MRAGLPRAVFLICAVMAFVRCVDAAQEVRGSVLDQTGLPLPGVTIQLVDGDAVIQSQQTDANGLFAIDANQVGDVVLASLEGFEPQRVARADASRIVLAIAHTSETTTVLAPASVEASPTTALLGSTLTATTVARLPSAHMHARDSLPLLPSVIRGADGLMQLGGARAYQTPITLDGFNVTDPATGLSSLNLPLEAVKGIDALRDPMAVTYGGLVGGLIKIDSRPGATTFAKGVQGFVPRPRFTTPGFGRLEGIFPRAFASGSMASGRIQYVAAGEDDYERIPVPEVTDRTGRDLVDDSAIVFTRVDARLSSRNTVTVEAFSFPARTRSFGLSHGGTSPPPSICTRTTHSRASSIVWLPTQLESSRFGSAPFRARLMLRHTAADRCCSRRPAQAVPGFRRSRGWPNASRPRRHGTVWFGLRVAPTK